MGLSPAIKLQLINPIRGSLVFSRTAQIESACDREFENSVQAADPTMLLQLVQNKWVSGGVLLYLVDSTDLIHTCHVFNTLPTLRQPCRRKDGGQRFGLIPLCIRLGNDQQICGKFLRHGGSHVNRSTARGMKIDCAPSLPVRRWIKLFVLGVLGRWALHAPPRTNHFCTNHFCDHRQFLISGRSSPFSETYRRCR
jgi:hypothetical protein